MSPERNMLFELLSPEEIFLVLKKRSSGSAQTSANHSLSKMSSPYPHSDLEILKDILPVALFESLRALGYTGLFVMSFAVRHQITLLSLAAQAHLALQRNNDAQRREIENSAHIYFPLSDWEKAQRVCADFTNSQFEIPILGFSSSGCYISYPVSNRCRAFDGVHLPFCPQKAEGDVFCPLHTEEMWWKNNPHEKGTTQARMFSFYGDRMNLGAYDEERLKNMTRDFWQSFQKQRPREASRESTKDLSQALQLFDIESGSALQALGKDGLRQRYLKLAVSKHPDSGGSHSAFVNLKQNYEILKDYLRC
jgi:hypothetical protein